MALDEPDVDEKPVEIKGVNVLITDRVKQYFEDATIDYLKDDHREGFTITPSEPRAPGWADDW